ncbi:MAG: trypsin-like peptidase domain-containing protein [Chlamydiae bacterium]|nr:trypsin-like peptidase domain-containing protein [Chlamydiota bacterium]
MSIYNSFYSSNSKSYFSAIASSSFHSEYESLKPVFDVNRMRQTDVLKVVESKTSKLPGQISAMNEVSLASVLQGVKECVGVVSSEGTQLGSCCLISEDLAILACHSIEGVSLSDTSVDFGFLRGDLEFFAGISYKVKGVVEYDPDLDYAIVALEDSPGKRHRFFSMDVCACVEAPALLHHPLSKPLQVSVHDAEAPGFSDTCLRVFHDSDYGSSGGAYISPEGNLIAIHLGSSLDFDKFNLQRLALPLSAIFNKNPSAIIGSLVNGLSINPCWIQDRLLETIPVFERDLIDRENFDTSRLIEYNQYRLRDPVCEKKQLILPGVIIEGYQIKHTPSWPGTRVMKQGSCFKLNLDETIELALKLIESEPIFSDPNPKDTTPSVIEIPVDKQRFGQVLYKKLKDVDSVNIYAAFDAKKQSWEMHFFPREKKGK